MTDSLGLRPVMTRADNISAVQQEKRAMSRQVHALHTRSGGNEDERKNWDRKQDQRMTSGQHGFIQKEEKKEASKEYPRDGKKCFFIRNVTRNRKAIEAKKKQIFSTHEKKK